MNMYVVVQDFRMLVWMGVASSMLYSTGVCTSLNDLSYVTPKTIPTRGNYSRRCIRLHDALSIESPEGRALQEIVALSEGRNPRGRDEDFVMANLKGFSPLINRARFSYQSPAYQQATTTW